MPNEEGLYSDTEFKGLLQDKQTEVRTRQEAQAESAQLKIRLAEVEARLEAKGSEPKDEGDLDKVMTKADMIKERKSIKEELRKEYLEEANKTTKVNKETAIQKSFDAAKVEMTELKMGKGLDFDSVWEGTKREIAKNKGYISAINSSKNPGKTAYEIGLKDDIFAKRAALSKKNFPNQERTPKIGAESTETPAQYFSQERVAKMTKEEIKANLPAIRESQKRWKG